MSSFIYQRDWPAPRAARPECAMLIPALEDSRRRTV